MHCYECEEELDWVDVELEFCYKHDRYAGQNRPLCDYCKRIKTPKIDSQKALDLRKQWAGSAD